MSEVIRSSIIERLVNGADVAAAYRVGANEAIDKLAAADIQSKELSEALDLLGVANARDIAERIGPSVAFDHRIMYMVVSGGGVKNVPDATCVAKRLRDKPNPTRRDVEEAFAACQK